ncbi:MAG: hypothetical protein R6V84_15785 [Desulfobacterales bacterium]
MASVKTRLCDGALRSRPSVADERTLTPFPMCPMMKIARIEKNFTAMIKNFAFSNGVGKLFP